MSYCKPALILSHRIKGDLGEGGGGVHVYRIRIQFYTMYIYVYIRLWKALMIDNRQDQYNRLSEEPDDQHVSSYYMYVKKILQTDGNKWQI